MGNSHAWAAHHRPPRRTARNYSALWIVTSAARGREHSITGHIISSVQIVVLIIQTMTYTTQEVLEMLQHIIEGEYDPQYSMTDALHDLIDTIRRAEEGAESFSAGGTDTTDA